MGRPAPRRSARRPAMSAEHPPPGTRPKRRFELHWELIDCGLKGHFIVGEDAAELRPEDAVFARQSHRTRWLRRLRYDASLALPVPERPARPAPPPPEATAPP